MKQRVTYFLPSGSGIDPADVKVGKDELTSAKAEHAAKETHITVGLSELPKELRRFLKDFHELHIRVASSENYDAFSPAVSRVPPGLHAFFTPQQANGTSTTKLCKGLKTVLGDEVKCDDSLESFSRPPILSERFASAATYQFFHEQAELGQIAVHLKENFCPGLKAGSVDAQLCKTLISAWNAAYVDYDYDVISHAVSITILHTPPKSKVKDERYGSVHKYTPGDRLEVGILAPEKADEPEELKMGGHLTVVGEDDSPSATLFSFPARHHPLPSGNNAIYHVSFQQPTGLHPKLDIKFPADQLQPPKDSCALHAYTTLPSALFVDSNQFTDPLFLASQNLVSLHAISGEQDLEAPDWVIKTWGSAALFELATPSKDYPSAEWTATIPLHLRYVNATTSEGFGEVSAPWPVVFWACEAEEGLKMSTNPFDRVNLGYDGLFGPKTMFYHVPPNPLEWKLKQVIVVPTMSVESSQWVSIGTLLAVLVGFGWVCWKLFGGSRPAAAAKKDEKKTK